MRIEEKKRVHFVGIGGIGISYVAHFFLARGAVVSGSDLHSNIVTDQLAEKGASVFAGHEASTVSEDIELVIYNDAIPQDNPELVRAKELDIATMTNFQAVGELSKKYKTIVIAGNKGKTTTTAMLGHVLANAGCDPTVMVGSIVNEWRCNFRGGASEYLVIEGDEFKEHFLEFNPQIVVITNMQPDHLDYFGTEEAYYSAFQKLVDKLPNDGLLVYNHDDEGVKKLTLPNCQVKTFGMRTTADVLGRNRRAIKGKQVVDISAHGQELGEWHFPFPGRFNVYNALAATSVALHLGVSPEQIAMGFAHFKGTWRRFQILGLYNMAAVISDYAHHPSAVHATLEAARDFYGDRRLIAIFQPHTRHRTKALFNDFVASFDEADLVIIPDIYDVAGREVLSDKEMNAHMLVDAIKERDLRREQQRKVMYGGNLAELKDKLSQIVRKDDVLLFMGAGDIYRLAEELA